MFRNLAAFGLTPPPLPAFASQCAVCRSWPAQQVCQPCVARFAAHPLRCSRCALALPADLSLRPTPAQARLCASCARQPPPADAVLAALPYAYPWSTLISHYKFGEAHGWAGFFAALLVAAPGVRRALEGLDAGDWVLPMPLSAERLQTRGFNQAWELARALARKTASRATTDAGLLLRVRHTRPQSELRREARLTNVKGAFQLDPLRAHDIRGRRVVLVDDVMTSGASVFTAAEALKAAGATHVTAVVLARTGV